MQDILAYRPGIKAVPQARILLVGPVGAGKSSFFNSINSAFRGNMTCQAISGTSDKSVTTQVSLSRSATRTNRVRGNPNATLTARAHPRPQYRTYRIKAGKSGKCLPLVLCDTMGLEEMKGAGLDTEDLVNIFKGHIADRYQVFLNPPTPPQPAASPHVGYGTF